MSDLQMKRLETKDLSLFVKEKSTENIMDLLFSDAVEKDGWMVQDINVIIPLPDHLKIKIELGDLVTIKNKIIEKIICQFICLEIVFNLSQGQSVKIKGVFRSKKLGE